MSGFAIPYYDLLIRLAVYQKDLLVPVRFKFQALPGLEKLNAQPNAQNEPDRPAIVMVQPVLEERTVYETLPLFNFPDLDPIRLWLSFGYIALTEGSLENEAGIFVLTEKTLSLDLIQSTY